MSPDEKPSRLPAEAGSAPSPGNNVRHALHTYELQLRRLASELSLAEARERREIASDLHDHIGQALAYVVQKLTVLQGNAVFSGFDSDFREILSMLKQTIKYTRDLTVEISPPVLYELGLPAAIDWLADTARERHNLSIKLTRSGRERKVPDRIGVFLFKALQELINNVVKHAQATSVDITTTWKDDRLELTVSDNGVGFDLAELMSGPGKNNCFGLFSIRERLSYIGGKLEIDSAEGRGTRVTLTSGYTIVPEDTRD